MALFCEDEFWNSSRIWPDEDYPQLSQCVQSTVLAYIPTIILIIGVGVQTKWKTSPEKEKFPNSLTVKDKVTLTLSLILTIMFGSDVLKNNTRETATAVVIAKFLNFANCFIALIAYYLQWRKRQKKGNFWCIFWLTYLICRTPGLYTVFLNASASATTNDYKLWEMLFIWQIYVFIAIQFLVAAFFANKTHDYEVCQMRGSPLSQFTLYWISPLITKAYRSTVSLAEIQSLPRYLKCGFLIEKTFGIHINTNLHDDPCVLLFARLARTFWCPFLCQSLLVLAHFYIRYVLTSLLLGCIIDFSEKDEPFWKGKLYSIGILVAMVVSSLMNHFANIKLTIIGMQLKSVIMATIYQKILKIQSDSRESFSVGSLTNMSVVETERFVNVVKSISYGVGSVLLTLGAFILVYHQVGNAAFVGVAVFICGIFLTLFGNHFMFLCQNQISAHKDRRLKETSELLSGIKVIKFFAWETAFANLIKTIRNDEYRALVKFTLWQASLRSMFTLLPLITALSVYAVYSISNQIYVIDARIAFVVLSLLASTRQSCYFFPVMLIEVGQTLTEIAHIGKFLQIEIPKRNDNVRQQLNPKNEVAIEINNGEFRRRTTQRETTLSNINLRLKHGQLIAVVGKVGCGKTTLLRAILREIDLVSGKMHIAGSLAYVPQLAWIRNATVKQNITFLESLDETKYQDIIEKCCLKTDLKLFDYGDATVIGERGTRLSGGQKQRINIAQAVYQDKDIYLMDDPLSALDSHVGASIFENVIGPRGLLKNKARFLITNNIQVLPDVDYIYVMDEGKIMEQGTFENLSKHGILFQKFSSETTRNSTDENDQIKQTNENDTEKEPTSQTQQDENEEADGSTISKELILQYLRNIGFCALIVIFISNILKSCTEMTNGYWLTLWTEDDPNSSAQQRDWRLLVFGLLSCFAAICAASCTISVFISVLRASNRLHNAMLTSLSRASIAFFNNTPSGRILNRFGNDMDMLDMQLPLMASQMLELFLMTLSFLIFVSTLTIWFGLFSLVFFIVIIVLQRLTGAVCRQLKRHESTTRSSVCNQLVETITGTDSIRAYRATDKFMMEFHKAVDQNQNCLFHQRVAMCFAILIVVLLSDVMIFALSLSAVSREDGVDANFRAFLICYAINTMFAIGYALEYASYTETALVAADRVQEYSRVEPEDFCTSAISFKGDWPTEGQIIFSNFSTRYNAALGNVLNNLNYRIEPGQKVAIVGRTGAGKSSLALALFRFLEATSGAIIIDDIDISMLRLQQLRSGLTIVPQDPVLFHGTLRFNLDPTNKLSDEVLWQKIKRLDLANAFKAQGLETMIEEFGANLSAGQRQLVCFARALLGKRKILIMDEPTSSTDVETDAFIQEIIRKDFANTTVLTIAHRISSILDYDVVIVLDRGSIVESGSPQKLITDQDSIFRQLAIAQNVTSDVVSQL